MVLRPADDGLQLVAANVHLTDAELVGVGVLVHGDQATDDHPVERAARALDLVHLQRTERQALGERLGRLLEIDEFREPAEGYPHLPFPVSLERHRRGG